MHTLESYDTLPYDRLPMPETEVDFLAAVAALHEFQTTDARTARVLELGCAQGGNLIPMAARYPRSTFVGVDLSRSQIEEGQGMIAALGLGNIQLVHGDIAALPDELGTFDYIIAHGVFSWIPETVRTALLAACGKRLRPQGLAYISFNVQTGWRTFGRIRDVLLEQDDAQASPVQRVARARSYLETHDFADAALNKEAQYLLRASPSYLFHEYLSDINQAFDFALFNCMVEAHGLRYLGDAGPRRARVQLDNDWGMSAEVRHERTLEAEAELDVALGTRFRRALLVRNDAPLPVPQSALQLRKLAFSAELSSDEELDFSSHTEQFFQTRTGERFPVANPLLKAALVVLTGAWPAAMAYPEVCARAQQLLVEYAQAASELSEESQLEFDEALLDFAVLHGLHLHTRSDLKAEPVGACPLATSLARGQAACTGWPVSSTRHQALDLDEWGRWLLTQLNGMTAQDQLAQRLEARLRAAGIAIEPGQAAVFLDNYLDFFARQGLLE